MDLQDYQNQIDRISKWRGQIYECMEFQLQSKTAIRLYEAIEYRMSTLNERDRNIASGYLDLGLFKNHNNEFRTACICVCLESEYQRRLNNEISRCSEYEGDEPIFDNPDIKNNRVKDLIDYRIFSREPLSNTFKLGDSWGYFDSRIPVQIYEWIDKCFKDSPCRIRVEPDGLYQSRPQQMLIECVIYPPHYQWWKNMSIYKGQTAGSVYQLLGNDIRNYNDYHDFNILKIRRLEVSETRKEHNYISMMIEELQEEQFNLNPNKKYVVGRMIHLDSNAAIGVNYKDAIINHIDLAYNLYIDHTADDRLNSYLPNGQVTPADFRTHILRIENIPFESLLKIADSFFKSKTLLSEWFSNEFI